MKSSLIISWYAYKSNKIINELNLASTKGHKNKLLCGVCWASNEVYIDNETADSHISYFNTQKYIIIFQITAGADGG